VCVLQITDADGELKFRQALTELLEQHREVVTMLAEGFTDCRRHIKVYITAFCSFLFHPHVIYKVLTNAVLFASILGSFIKMSFV